MNCGRTFWLAQRWNVSTSVRAREPLNVCVAAAQDAGRKYISVASYVLAGEK